GVYHIINRGNYRQDLFMNDGAHEAFERCLFEACEKCGWILEGHCVMTNHFHLVVRTPEGNLSYGMKWLQATFANRYHRVRKVHGKLFQGRFKSLIVEGDGYLGALQHYVHLNPVRAGMCGSPMCSNATLPPQTCGSRQNLIWERLSRFRYSRADLNNNRSRGRILLIMNLFKTLCNDPFSASGERHVKRQMIAG
ncbi:MAG: transposase, partial [Rhodobacteraceae bacterium]|nr:transposase [Paracoccaceae bacterium]